MQQQKFRKEKKTHQTRKQIDPFTGQQITEIYFDKNQLISSSRFLVCILKLASFTNRVIRSEHPHPKKNSAKK